MGEQRNDFVIRGSTELTLDLRRVKLFEPQLEPRLITMTRPSTLRKINHEETDSHRYFLFFLRCLRFFVVDFHGFSRVPHCDMNISYDPILRWDVSKLQILGIFDSSVHAIE